MTSRAVRRATSAGVWLLVAGIAADVAAQSTTPGAPVYQEGALDVITQRFEDAAATWYPVMKVYARNLLLTLAAISITWNAFQWALKRQDLQDFAREFTMFVLLIGFYLIAIEYVDVWSRMLVDSFQKIAMDVLPEDNPLMVGDQLELSPSTVVSKGYDLWQEYRAIPTGFANLGSGLILTIAGVVATILFAGIAAYLLLLKVEGVVIIAGGVIFLGFAGTEWTLDTAKNYLRYLLSFAVKLFAVWIIVAIGITLVQELVLDPIETAQQFNYPPQVYEQLVVNSAFFALIVPLAMLVLSFMVPAIFQQIVGGIGSHGAFAMNSVLTTTLLTASSAGQSILQRAGPASLAGGALLQGMGQAGFNATSPLASSGQNIGNFLSAAGGAGSEGLKAGFAEAKQGAWDAFKQPGMNEGSFVHGVSNHFFPESFQKGNGGAGSVGGRGA